MKNIDNYKVVFQDYWSLFLRYSSISENDSYWSNLSDDVNKLYLRHGSAPVSMEMGLLIMKELERVFKSRKGV